MTTTASKITQFCNLITNNSQIKDFPGARNGLQFKGKKGVRKVGAAVDAGAEVFNQAAKRGIDYLIVHHGIHWSTVSPKNQVKKLRQKSLRKNKLSLYSSHLPLDAHPAIGNNVLIAQDLGLKVQRWFVDYEGVPIACICRGISRKN
jgi:putative NIF3 family GTP cyclohydrolase 1 type 2